MKSSHMWQGLSSHLHWQESSLFIANHQSNLVQEDRYIPSSRTDITPMKLLLAFEPGSASGVGDTWAVSSSIVFDEFCRLCRSLGSDADDPKGAATAELSKGVRSFGEVPPALSEAPSPSVECRGESITTASNVAKPKGLPQTQDVGGIQVVTERYRDIISRFLCEGFSSSFHESCMMMCGRR